jgi:hypothetical protein
MKIVITEDQFKTLQESDRDFKKTKSLVVSMYNNTKDIEEIMRYTGLDLDVVILCLMDEKLFEKVGKCGVIGDFFYGYIFDTEFIEKRYSYDDGSIVKIDYSSLEGVLNISYFPKNGDKLYGYATFLWDGMCKLPIDLISFIFKGREEIYDSKGIYDAWSPDKEFRSIETIRQLIDYFNKNYFKILKKPLETLYDEYILDYKKDD